MAGILKTLFGGGNSNKDQGPAYFLDSDSAKTLGNIDYMRTPKSVKKSYAQAVGKLNVISGEVEESISAMEKKQVVVNGRMTSTTPSMSSSSTPSMSSSSSETPTVSSSSSETPTVSSSSSETPTFSNTSTSPSRSSDSSMDSFRDMARNMKKR